MTDTEAAQKDLPQRALKQIRALCQGNGVAADSVQIKSARGSMIVCEAITHIELHPDLEEEKKKGRYETGQVLENPEKLQEAIDELLAASIKSEETRKFLANMLLERPDKGFSLHAEYFDVPPLKRDYCFHEPCGTCGGQGRISCNRCGGQGREVCSQCHGRTMLSCTYCHGSGFTQGPDGQQIQCSRCFGQRQVACPLCQKTGSIACRQCKGSGSSKCNACGGNAFYTNITHLNVKLKTLFEIDRAALPDPVVKIIEDNGAKMAEKGHIKLHAEQVKREDGGLAIQYTAEFPYGDLELAINGKPLKTHLFGYKGKMLRLPNFLDKLVEPNFQNLQQAANGEGAVAGKVRKAANSRLIAQGLLFSVTMPPKKAMKALKQKFPMGASNDLIKQIIVLSNQALTNVTRKTRFGGIGLGMVITTLINAAYFIGPVRHTVESSLNNPIFLTIADLSLIVLGGLICTSVAKTMAKRPLKKALGSLMPAKQRGKFKPKTSGSPLPAYIASAIVFFAVIMLTKFIGGAIPNWFPF